jgi:hypothetical protein
MKKAFEFLLILIIFYGVYSAFNDALPYMFPDLASYWIIVVSSLLFSVGLLFLYSWIISSSAKKMMNEKIHTLEGNLKEKDEEIKNAFKIKKAVEEEAEKTITESL